MLDDASAGGSSGLTADSEVAAARHRYGAVFALIFIVVVFIIAAPEGKGSRAVSFALVGAALVVSISTARERTSVRRRRRTLAVGAVVAIALGIAIGVLPKGATFGLSALLTVAVPITLVRGLMRLVRGQGVTFQAVAGALAIYLLVGLTFASIIGFMAAVGPSPYFAQGSNGTASRDVYYSFTVLTTTGFGDLTAGYALGRAVAVIEMLIGQLYLVTVIGILIGRRVGER